MRNVVSTHEDVRPCPACGGDMVRETRRRVVRYANRSTEIDQPAWWCRARGEGILDAKDSMTADRAFTRLKCDEAKGDRSGA